MSYREPDDEPTFTASLAMGQLSSPLGWVPHPSFVLPLVLLVFVVGPALLLAARLRVNPLATLVPLLIVVSVLFAVLAQKYKQSLAPNVKVYADRLVFATKRRTITMPRRDLSASVDHRRWGSPPRTYTCIVLISSDRVALTIGIPWLLGPPSGRTGLPQLECDEDTFRSLADALSLSLPPRAPPAKST